MKIITLLKDFNIYFADKKFFKHNFSILFYLAAGFNLIGLYES